MLQKTNALICWAVTGCAVIKQLICAFVTVYANQRFSHDAAQIMSFEKVIHVLQSHTVQPGSLSTVGSFSTVDPVVGRICLQCKY